MHLLEKVIYKCDRLGLLQTFMFYSFPASKNSVSNKEKSQNVQCDTGKERSSFHCLRCLIRCLMYSIFRNANGRNKCIVFSATPTGYNSRWDAINVGGCLLGRFFRKLTEFQPNFFSNIKKLPKLLLQFFSIFFSKKFFYENFFLQMFFW